MHAYEGPGFVAYIILNLKSNACCPHCLRNPKVMLLKGPKREIFDSGVFAQIRPIWIGDLGTRPKNY